MKRTIIMLALASGTFVVNSQPTAFQADSFLATQANGKRIYINEVNIKAVRDFSKAHSKASDIKWHEVRDGFIVNYNLHGIRSRSAYNVNGDWTYTLNWYNEFKLPSSVRHLVKSTYYDYDIKLAIEITNKNQKFYQIQMENKSSLKTILVSNGEMKVTEDLKKN